MYFKQLCIYAAKILKDMPNAEDMVAEVLKSFSGESCPHRSMGERGGNEPLYPEPDYNGSKSNRRSDH